MLIETYNKSITTPIIYHIDAFDINAKVIETARQGVYNTRSVREDGSCFKYAMIPYLKEQNNKYYVDNSLKENINFFVHNLMDELHYTQYDIVFFRNAFIYFLPEKRERILSNLSHIIKEDGVLILGVSETAGVHHELLVQRIRKFLPPVDDVFYFQKAAVKPFI